MPVGFIAQRFDCHPEKVIDSIHGLILLFNIVHLVVVSWGMSSIDSEKQIPNLPFITEKMVASWSETQYNIFATAWGLIFLLYSYMYRRHKEKLQKVISYTSDRQFDLAGFTLLTCIFWFAAAVSLATFVSRGLYCTDGQAYCVRLLPRTKGWLAALIILGFFNTILWAILAGDAGFTAHALARDARESRDIPVTHDLAMEENNIGTRQEMMEGRSRHASTSSWRHTSSQDNTVTQS